MLKDGKIIKSPQFYPKAEIQIGERDGWPVALIEGPAFTGNKGTKFIFDYKTLSQMKEDMQAGYTAAFDTIPAKSDLDVVERALVKLKAHMQEPAMRAIKAIEKKEPDSCFLPLIRCPDGGIC